MNFSFEDFLKKVKHKELLSDVKPVVKRVDHSMIAMRKNFPKAAPSFISDLKLAERLVAEIKKRYKKAKPINIASTGAEKKKGKDGSDKPPSKADMAALDILIKELGAAKKALDVVKDGIGRGLYKSR